MSQENLLSKKNCGHVRLLSASSGTETSLHRQDLDLTTIVVFLHPQEIVMTLIRLCVSKFDQRFIVCSIFPMIVLHLYHVYVKMSLMMRGSRRSNYDECLCACTCHDALAKMRALLLRIRTQSWYYNNKELFAKGLK